MKKIISLLMVLFVALTLAACTTGTDDGGETGSEKKVYIVAESGEAATLNPDTTADDNNYDISQNLFSRLVKLNNKFQVLPDLATSWDTSDDALTYTFHLVENATWHDGEPVTADDVVYTFQTCVDNNFYSATAVFSLLDKIEKVDDYTVSFTLTAPDNDFMGNIAWYGTFILPQHVLEGTDWMTDESFSENPIGCGPFKFEAWNKGTDVRLVKNENYFGDTPILDEVIYTIIPDTDTAYQAWLNDEVDEISSGMFPASEYDTLLASDYKCIAQTWPSPFYVAFNCQKGRFANNPELRRAFAMAINREEVSTKAWGGHRAPNDYYISKLWVDAVNDDAKQPAYDPEGAMALLEKLGYTKNADGYYMDIEFKIMDGGFTETAEVIVENLKAAGIDCKLNVLDYNIWDEQCNTGDDFELTMLAGFQGPTVTGALRRWTKDGGINIPRYTRPEVEDLALKIKSATTDAEINDLMKQCQVYLAEDVPFMTLISYDDLAFFKNYITGHPQFPEAIGKTGFSELTYVDITR